MAYQVIITQSVIFMKVQGGHCVGRLALRVCFSILQYLPRQNELNNKG